LGFCSEAWFAQHSVPASDYFVVKRKTFWENIDMKGDAIRRPSSNIVSPALLTMCRRLPTCSLSGPAEKAPEKQ
jgi:hypothetical protein